MVRTRCWAMRPVKGQVVPRIGSLPARSQAASQPAQHIRTLGALDLSAPPSSPIQKGLPDQAPYRQDVDLQQRSGSLDMHVIWKPTWRHMRLKPRSPAPTRRTTTLFLNPGGRQDVCNAGRQFCIPVRQIQPASGRTPASRITRQNRSASRPVRSRADTGATTPRPAAVGPTTVSE